MAIDYVESTTVNGVFVRNAGTYAPKTETGTVPAGLVIELDEQISASATLTVTVNSVGAALGSFDATPSTGKCGIAREKGLIKFAVEDVGLAWSATYTPAGTPFSAGKVAEIYDAMESGGVGSTGPQGPQGLTGPQGPQGVAGPQGSTGATGSTGPQGSAGPQGSVGPQGVAGSNGSTGGAGPQGSTGPQGVAGTTGATGATGASGDTLLSGLTGDVLITSVANHNYLQYSTSGNKWKNVNTLDATMLSGTLPALNGSALTTLNGSNISSGSVAVARLNLLIGANGSLVNNTWYGNQTVDQGTITIKNTHSSAGCSIIERPLLEGQQVAFVFNKNTSGSYGAFNAWALGGTKASPKLCQFSLHNTDASVESVRDCAINLGIGTDNVAYISSNVYGSDFGTFFAPIRIGVASTSQIYLTNGTLTLGTSSDSIAFYGTTVVAQQTISTAATDYATAISEIQTVLFNLGLAADGI